MTTLLERAFAEAATLPPEEQDALAAYILEELHAGRRRQYNLAGSAATLQQLADEALIDYRAGRTHRLPRGHG